jgi:cation:H+ antiporter
MGLLLIGLYGVYFAVLMRGFGQEEDDDEDENEDEDEDDGDEHNILTTLLTFDFNQLIFGGREFNASRAWTVLSLATLTIAGACYILSESVMLSAESLNIPPYFTAVILGAAATSVPDTILSYKDAMKGDYDDAVANAVGSNIFDICVALGLPLVLYTSLKMLNGEDGSISIAIANAASDGGVQTLQIVLMLISIAIIGLFLIAPKEEHNGETMLRIGKGHGFAMLGIYAIWTGYILTQIISG